MNNKPPAFQFFVKDWRSSPTVRSMTRQERGTYIDLLALAWESEGFLIGPVSEIARSLPGCNVRSILSFITNFPQCFPKVTSNFEQTLNKLSAKFDETRYNPKLRKQWEETEKYKENQSLAGKLGNEKRWGNQSQPDSGSNRSASAPAIGDTPRRKRQVFQKPTRMQIFDVMVEYGIIIAETEADKFLAYHESKGWKVGRSPMVNWKAAIRTWQHNLGLFGGNGNGPSKAEARLRGNSEALTGALELADERDRNRAGGPSGSAGRDTNKAAH